MIQKIILITRPIRIPLRVIKYWMLRIQTPKSISRISNTHFRKWSSEDHINRQGLIIGLNELNCSHPVIFETGTSAYGVDSSRLFDQVAHKFDGTFISVDINPAARRALFLQHSRKSKFYISDSVEFIEEQLPQLIEKIDFCYLDSWDVDWDHPLASASHGLKEFQAVRHFLRKGSVLVVDDTPISINLIPEKSRAKAKAFLEEHGVLPGKGAFILQELLQTEFADVLFHNFNLVLKIK